jgi:predicted dehydrogenase
MRQVSENTVGETRIGFGLIGLGRISRAHLKGLRAAEEHGRVVAVCDRNGDVAHAVAAEVGARAYTDYRELLRDVEVAAVDLALPHNLHHEVAYCALEAGKHVLIEKPMAPTERQCADLIDLARWKGVTLSVAENTRFVSAYIEAERLVRQGVLGFPRLVRTFICGSSIVRLSDVTSWKRSVAGTIGGTIFDAGPHSFYLLKWLFGEIESIRAFKNRLVESSEVEDHAVVAGRMKSGAVFTTEYTFTAEVPWGERLEVYGSEGSLIVDQLCNPPALHFQGASDMTGTPLAKVPYDPEHWKTASIAAGVAAFAKAVRLKQTPPVDPQDGQYAMRAVGRAYRSVEADGALVAM